jgi:hypothetical protein
MRGSWGVAAQQRSTQQDPTSEPLQLETVIIITEGLHFCREVLE